MKNAPLLVSTFPKCEGTGSALRAGLREESFIVLPPRKARGMSLPRAAYRLLLIGLCGFSWEVQLTISGAAWFSYSRFALEKIVPWQQFNPDDQFSHFFRQVLRNGSFKSPSTKFLV